MSNRQESALIGLYGKHPGAREFLRHNAVGMELQRLDQWLSRALERGRQESESWQEAFGGLFPVWFLSCLEPQGGRCLLGLMVASQDQVGRLFPLILFAELDASQLAGRFHLCPSLFFLHAGEQVLGMRTRQAPEQLVRAVERLPAPNEATFQMARCELGQYLQQSRCGSTFASMFGERWAQRGAAALTSLRELGGAVGPGQPLPRYALRLPLGHVPAGNASLWLGVIGKAMGSGVVLPSAVLWSRRGLLLSFRQPGSRALLTLQSPEPAGGDTLDLVHPEGAPCTSPADPLAPDLPLSALVALD